MKSNKRFWALTMAGALAVSNLSAIALPFGGLTAFAAVKPTGAVLILSASSIIKGGKTTATLKEQTDGLDESGEDVSIAIVDAKGSDASSHFTVGNATTGKSVTDGSGYSANSTRDITAKSTCPAGIYTIKATSTKITTAVEKTLEVKSPASTITIAGETKNIPTAESTWSNYTTTFETFKLTATETVASGSTAEDIVWKIFDDDDNAVAADAFTYTDSVSTSGKEDITIAADKAGAGGYYVVAQTEDGSVKSDKYGFTVEADPKLDVVVKESPAPASLIAGQEVHLLAFSDGKTQITSGIEWSLASESDKDKASISNSGVVTALSEEAASGINFDATYKMNDDMSIKKAGVYTLSIAASEYAIEVEKTTLEIGDTTQARLMFGTKPFTGTVTWTSSDPTKAKIDSNGVITALDSFSSNNVTITAAYKLNNKNYTRTFDAFSVNETKYVYYADGKEVASTSRTIPVTIGKTVQLAVKSSNSSAIPTYKWTSSDETVATVDSNGLVTVRSTASENDTAEIYAINSKTGKNLANYTVEVQASKAAYTLTLEGVKLDGTAPLAYTASMYYGEEATLVALLDKEEDFSGEWSITSAGEGNISIKNNVVTVKKPIIATDSTGTKLSYKVDNTEVLAITIKATADEYNLYDLTGGKDPVKATGTGTPTGAFTIAKLESGETYEFSVKKGATDITKDMTWVSDNTDVATVEGGVITTVGAGRGTKITGTYTVDSGSGETDLAKFEITITETVVGTGAAKDAETAAKEADTAKTKAEAASTAAETAAAAAEATKKDPTAENLSKAEEALKTANSNLTAAQTALANAEAALEKAIADGAESESAKLAVKEAKEAVDAAAEVVAQAEKDVKAAQKTFDEAASEVEKAKKAEEEKKKQEEEQKKSDGSSKDTPAPVGNELKDAAGNATGFVVTNATPGAAEAEYKGLEADKSAKKVTIPNEVKDHSGNVYKVTSIADSALENAKGKELVIGKNIKKIGKSALKGAKFKKITIKTNKKGQLKIGKGAFKVKNKKCVIKIKGAKDKYKKKLIKKIKKQATKGVTVK